MTIELVQIATPAVSLFGILATPFLTRMLNGSSTKADRREEYKSAEEFLEKLTDKTPALVVEKWYEAMSLGDKADATEVRYMLKMDFTSKVFGLRRNGKEYAKFLKAEDGRAAGYRYKGLWKYKAIRWGYNLGNLAAYVALIWFPALPAVIGKQDMFDKAWPAVLEFCVFSIASFCVAITRIKAWGSLSCAVQLVERSQEVPSSTPAQAPTITLVPDDQDRDAA